MPLLLLYWKRDVLGWFLMAEMLCCVPRDREFGNNKRGGVPVLESCHYFVVVRADSKLARRDQTGQNTIDSVNLSVTEARLPIPN